MTSTSLKPLIGLTLALAACLAQAKSDGHSSDSSSFYGNSHGSSFEGGHSSGQSGDHGSIFQGGHNGGGEDGYGTHGGYGGGDGGHNGGSDGGDVPCSPVPEPDSLALMLAGLGMVGVMVRRRKV